MENYFFMRPLLRLMAQGPFVYRAAATILRVFTGLIILGSLAAFFNAGKAIFELPTTSAIFGGVIFQLFFVIAIYAVAHVLIIRARDIETLNGSMGDIYMLPLTAVLLKMLGEVYASFIALMAIGSSVFVWFTSKHVGVILGPFTEFFPGMHDASFVSGIEFLVTSILIALATVIVSYLSAEILLLIGRSARNGYAQVPRQLPPRQGLKSRVS